LVNSDQTIAELELIISGLNTIRAYKSELLEEGYERLVSLAKRHFRDRAKSLGLRFVESEVENEPIFVSDIAAIGNTAALAAVMAISENKEFWAWMYFDVAATLLPENVKALYASAMCYFAVGRSIEKPEYVSRAKVLAERALSKIHSLNYYEIFVGGVNTAQATKNLREIVSHG
ncbi:MAG: hypothetical protein N2Z75_06670, partial [Meiothermus sp.]|nr:hypothetical protein [Meiothermus sp.]